MSATSNPIAGQRGMWESEKAFSSYAQIDLLYYGLKELQKELSSSKKPTIVIEQMIDKMFEADISTEKNAKIIESGIEISTKIIKLKKYLRADYSADETFLEGLKKLKK